MVWNQIADELTAAVATATRRMLAAHDGEHVYAFALYTADDGMSVAMAANTEEAFQAHLASEAEDEENSVEDEIYYRWSSSEWKFERIESDLFVSINKLLAQADKSEFDSYFQRLIEHMTSALKNTKEMLGDRVADITAFVTVTDSDEAEHIENQSAMKINSVDLAHAFQSRYG